MKDSTAIRLGELGCGCFALFIHAQYRVDGILLLIIAILFGVPIEIVYEKVKKSG